MRMRLEVEVGLLGFVSIWNPAMMNRLSVHFGEHSPIR